MAPTLRDFQVELVEKTRQSFLSGKKAPLIVAPCGSGKTVLFSYFTQAIVAKGNRVLLLAHRAELIDQISETLAEFSVPHSFIAAGMPFNPMSRVHVGSVMSVARRLGKTHAPDVVIVDECHHSCASTWKKVFDFYPSARRIGVTASPIRLSGEPLGDIYDDMLIGPSVSDLIARGFLCRYRIFAPSTIDVTGLQSRGGDYAKGQLTARARSITGDAINEYRNKASGKRAIVFCTTLEHANEVAANFNAVGISSATIDGTMSRQERRVLVSAYKAGKILVLTSVDVVSEGFNLPAIECAIMLRPTQSLGLWLQQSGRALRPLPGKECAILLDHAGNCERHGLPCDDREWSLTGKPGPVKSPVRCNSCYGYQSKPGVACEFCGAILRDISTKDAKSGRSELEQVDGELVEIDPTIARRARAKEQMAARTYEELVELGRARGYRSAERWAKYLCDAREKKGNGR